MKNYRGENEPPIVLLALNIRFCIDIVSNTRARTPIENKEVDQQNMAGDKTFVTLVWKYNGISRFLRVVAHLLFTHDNVLLYAILQIRVPTCDIKYCAFRLNRIQQGHRGTL